MAFRRKEILISFLLIILMFLPLNVMPQEKKGNQKVFKGVVVEISQGFITIGRTIIALPKNVKALDAHGGQTTFDTIRKGDSVSVTVGEKEAVIRKTSGETAVKDEPKVPK
jgi:hypothetical protein